MCLLLFTSGGHSSSFFFFFNDTATTEIYTLSLHDALPICFSASQINPVALAHLNLPASKCPLFNDGKFCIPTVAGTPDRKSTRLNSSHSQISYAVFCLKKKKTSMQSLSSTASTLRQSPSYC